MKLDLKIFDFLTLPIKTLASLSLASGILLFSSNYILKKLHMIDFMNKYGFYIGIIFLVTFALCLVTWINSLLESLIILRKKRKFFAEAKGRLLELTILQKTIIYELYSQDNHTLELPIHDGAILTLSNQKIIGRISDTVAVSDINDIRMPYLLQPWVVNEINKNADLLSNLAAAHSQTV